MRRFVRIGAIVILVVGSFATYAARGWRLSHALTPEAIAAIPERLAGLPLEIERPLFRGTREEVEERIIELSGADHSATVVYRAADGGSVRLHVGAAVRTGDWLHEPVVCLPTHGWTTRHRARVPVWSGLDGADPDAKVWRLVLRKAGQDLLVYYWFQWGDHVVASRFQRSWRRFQALLAGESDRPVQIVILYAPLSGGLGRTEERVEALIGALWPTLSNVLSTGESDHGPSAP